MHVSFLCHYDEKLDCNVIHKLEISRGQSKKVYSDSQLFYMIKQELNKLASSTHKFIKKEMIKDGHMVSEGQYYIRSKNKVSIKKTHIMIHDANYQIRNLYEDYNKNTSVLLDVVI